MKKILRLLVLLAAVLIVQPSNLLAQANAGDKLVKGQGDIEDVDISGGAAIASSKLATDVLVEADAGDGMEVVTNTLHVKSDETDFLNAAAALTCGSSTTGQVAMVASGSVLNYCDNVATPVQHYLALAASDGDALAGDTATAFFDAGTLEPVRGGTGIDTSGSTGVPRIAAGTWTADAKISNLATSTSADLLGVLSDEEGTGVAVFNINPTLQDVTVNDLLTFTETAGDDTCGAGDFWIKGNDTSNLLRACEDGSLFSLSAGGSAELSIAAPEALTISGGVVTLTGAANTLTYHTIDTEASAAQDDLPTINCTAGSKHVIYAFNSARTVTVQAHSGPDFNMDNVADRMGLHCPAADTVEAEFAESGGA